MLGSPSAEWNGNGWTAPGGSRVSLEEFALEMVTEAAVTGCLTHKALTAFRDDYALADRLPVEVQREILQVLEHDGYLEQRDK